MKVMAVFISVCLLYAADGYGQRLPGILKYESYAFGRIRDESKTITPEEASAYLDSIENNLKIIHGQLAEIPDTEYKKRTSLVDRVTRYQGMALSYEKILENNSKKKGVEQEIILIRRSLEIPVESTIDISPPYSLSFYDGLLSEISVIRQKKRTGDTEVELIRKSIEYNMDMLSKISKELRNKRDQYETESGSRLSGFLWEELEDLKIETDFIQSDLYQKRSELELLGKETLLSEFKIEKLERQIHFVKNNLIYDERDIERQFTSIREKREALEKRYNILLNDQKKIDRSRISTKESLLTDKRMDIALEDETLKARSSAQEIHRSLLNYTEKMLSLLRRQEVSWKNRYQLIREKLPQQTLLEWENSIAHQLEIDKQVLFLEQKNQIGLHQELIPIETRIATENVDDSLKRSLKSQILALKDLSEKRNEYVNMLFSTQLLDEKLLKEISDQLEKKFFVNQVSYILQLLKIFWHYEIWSIDDKPLTVRKIVFAFIIFISGMIGAKYLLSMFRNYLVTRSQFKEVTIAVVHKLIAYFTYLMILLLTLRMVNIPLAAFAFFGGAIAIGLGFGVQNLINNFISGFIIMGEQPINIGDLIEIDGILGKVEEIGARCTRIRTGENIHILVPNSSFLEKNITNWTLSDRKIRAMVPVGVIYGSDLERVKRLLLEAVLSTDNILRFPDPFILFKDFGESALIFEVYFWITVRQIIERKIIESNVRFRINELFQRAGIIIAFPQRDTHIYTPRPLELKVVNTYSKDLDGKNESEKNSD